METGPQYWLCGLKGKQCYYHLDGRVIYSAMHHDLIIPNWSLIDSRQVWPCSASFIPILQPYFVAELGKYQMISTSVSVWALLHLFKCFLKVSCIMAPKREFRFYNRYSLEMVSDHCLFVQCWSCVGCSSVCRSYLCSKSRWVKKPHPFCKLNLWNCELNIVFNFLLLECACR